MSKDKKMGVVQGSRDFPPGEAPYKLLQLVWQEYHKRHREQTLERIQERGGFGWNEIIQLLRGEYLHDNGRLKQELAELEAEAS